MPSWSSLPRRRRAVPSACPSRRIQAVTRGPPRLAEIGPDLAIRRPSRTDSSPRRCLPSSCPLSAVGCPAGRAAVAHRGPRRRDAAGRPDGGVHCGHRRPGQPCPRPPPHPLAMSTAAYRRALQRSLQVPAQAGRSRRVHYLSTRASTQDDPGVQPMSAKRPHPMATSRRSPGRRVTSGRASVLGHRPSAPVSARPSTRVRVSGHAERPRTLTPRRSPWIS